MPLDQVAESSPKWLCVLKKYFYRRDLGALSMNIRPFTAAAAAAITLSSGVIAADFSVAPVEAPFYAAEPAYNWNGFYAGVNAGYGWAELSWLPSGSATDDVEGVTGGVQAGVNYDLGGFVLGAEADLNITDIQRTVVTAGIASATIGLDYYGTVRARAGYAFNRFLPYVTGGIAYGRFDTELSIAGLGVIVSDSENHVGWTIGAGAEYAVTDNLTVRAEYLYGDLGTKSYDFVTPLLVVAEGEARLTYQTARIGLNYKF